MLLLNRPPAQRPSLTAQDAEWLGHAGAERAAEFLAIRDPQPTPLQNCPAFAAELGILQLSVKDEGKRLGLGSFKALGGSYAVARLVLDDASRRLGREFAMSDLQQAEVRAIAQTLTFACATDGNHGRSVAQGAAAVGARSVIFVHAGVSEARIAAIARFGARIVRCQGTYDDSVAEAAQTSEREGWTVVSDTSWPGYERIPSLVMQGYTALLDEALAQMGEHPTHLFIQAGVGGIAAALAGHFAAIGTERPIVVVVEPERAACLFETARVGAPVRIAHGEPTVMAMLECYEPSLVAWRILQATADAFMTVTDDAAIAMMSRLGRPTGGDPAIVAGESGVAGLAGLAQAARDPALRESLQLDASSRVLVVNTEGATDPERYRELTGLDPERVG